MYNSLNFEKAERIKGYGSYKRAESEADIKVVHTVVGKNPLKVQPVIVHNLKEYIDFISKIETSYVNPVFYRGQPNADYLLTPNCLRVNPKNENLMIENFTRKFFDEISKSHSAMERLVLMQHYQLPTRCLDVSESPLLALYFACSHMKKFRKIIYTEETEDWGEIVLFREPGLSTEKPDELKAVDSSNISIIANTAYMGERFNLWQLGAGWKKDVDVSHSEKYLDLRSIVRKSYIVRVPQTNPRIKNQQGAFIMVNANMAYVDDDFSDSEKLTELILSKDKTFTYEELVGENIVESLKEDETWDLKFKKICPYSAENNIDVFRTDPFDLRRLFYKENDVQKVVLIPPLMKENILKELEKLGITEDFVYPDMDNVANEIALHLGL